MTIRYGIIGAGMMGQEHIRNLHLIPDATVTAIADPDEAMRTAALAAAGGDVQGFPDYHQMLSADLCDAYVLVTPNDLHYSHLLDLLTTSKPLLVEKPLCTTSEHCREVLARAAGRNAPVWVAMEYRYMPPMQQLLAELRAGRVGTPRMMAIREHRFPFLEKVGDWNRFNIRTGGTLTEKCCHFWDLMRFTLQSDPVRVYASGAVDVNHRDERYNGRMPDIIDNAFVTIDFASGARGLLDLCMFAEGAEWQEVITVTGEAARLEAFVPGPARFAPDGKERHAEIEISDRASKQVTRETVLVDEGILGAGDHHGSTYYQHLKFAEIVRTGRGTPEVTLEDGLWSVRVGEAAELSAQTGQAVTL